jgi:hypothetical protein
MSDVMLAYGRVDGQVEFQYGPKSFSADWGGVFTALDIANLATKLPKVSVGKRTPRAVDRSGKLASRVSHLMWIERLEMSLISLDLNSMMINATKSHIMWIDKVLPSQLIIFSGQGKGPSELIADALVRIGLNKWGVLQQLTLVADEFDQVASGGTRSLSVFITV